MAAARWVVDLDAAASGHSDSGNALASIFKQNAGHCQICRMRQGQGYVSDSHGRCQLRGTSMKPQCGPSPGFANHLNLQPVHAPADPGSQGLCAGLLGRKTGGETLGSLMFALAVRPFRASEDSVQETLSESFQGLLNAPDFNQVDTASDDHSVYQAKSFRATHHRDAGAMPKA